MNKDYLSSTKYTVEEIERLEVPYSLQDSCVDELADYLSCRRYKGSLVDNPFFYKIPFSGAFTACGSYNTIWNKCQKKREHEIFEQVAKVYKETYKQSLDKDIERRLQKQLENGQKPDQPTQKQGAQ